MPIEDQESFAAGLALLRTHLRGAEGPPNRELLRKRIETFAQRPRPFLPGPSSFLARWPSEGECFPPTNAQFCWVKPELILLKRSGIESFIHDTSDSARLRATPSDSDAVDGVADFALRLFHEVGDATGLGELFGPLDPGRSVAYLDIAGYRIPRLPAIHVVTVNGNHRLAALAALRVPCVLAL
ncbi:MAG: hypothetical protein M3Y35_10980, partial [Actinomycetota bacterium]|nr:hypothetical protein [Actinomycetota bacterium]